MLAGELGLAMDLSSWDFSSVQGSKGQLLERHGRQEILSTELTVTTADPTQWAIFLLLEGLARLLGLDDSVPPLADEIHGGVLLTQHGAFKIVNVLLLVEKW
jgi:hypothetical protein